MKLIIDISEEDYKECKFRNDLLSLGGKPTDLTFNMRMETLIAEGTPLQTELEDIRAEIKKIPGLSEDYLLGKWRAIKIIDNRIKELKGENNEQT